MEERTPILRPGETCWRIETADRLAVIVDAADYFTTLHEVMQKAQHSVIMIGWEFDTRIDLDPRKEADDVPKRMGRFLSWLACRRPDLNIYLLQWDVGLLSTLWRGSTPLRLVDWILRRRIRLKLDHAHPSGSAHHQKIIVIDDALAFCGGIDATADRWDTPEHLDDSPFRRRPTTKRPYDPWHDATTAVDGDAARALGELARTRWERATGERIPPTRAATPLWPSSLVPMIKNARVAISRTEPAYAGHGEIHEIEALYLAIISATRRVLYIESQYFASRVLAEAIAARLGEPDGPEFIVINPETSDGWLEENTMGSARARLLELVRKADIHGRFRLYTPVTRHGAPIYVHAKIVIMDDTLMRVGSSNLNNRSLGFDTECDLSVEARPGMPGEDRLRMKIAGLRNGLLAEHLEVDVQVVDQAVDAAEGSLIGAVEALRGTGRSLVAFVPPDFGYVGDKVLRENNLLDPERPARRRWRRLRQGMCLPLGQAGKKIT
ncbi:phospholipase D-like domain-containing protein [Lutimaribacter sp. EGI FJ00015]|uniref:Phospholipase D-like domain-containing protein n=1 Tax=Lutimaribacter degradans TaxID=2945989 RepID=A0ACC6A0P5_9RHOB|nr:phospholipase D-like domain-containing protein [Lutimaribacter sp. EGI FJ00013]MCM2563748.1 phospholipase D-like domain-containing protein [Lutimaribacter sp. EGI FJ00013]MCO0614933.1 phospholipase D-like domain-containing protein [Lutimaribacter sp. EGI FJ00015]MCO0637586.1 phospholipase D-like domain-containing protein [Lutimaribacter sp. EGI FJ00014]